MRESMGRYRGKRIDNGERVCGAYVRRECHLPWGATTQHYIYQENLNAHMVDPETVEIGFGHHWLTPDEAHKIITEHLAHD